MIARLRGELLECGSGRIVVDAGGVGYEALVAEAVLLQMPPLGQQVDIHVRQVIREDSSTLYGFLDPFERRIFDLLTEVKGCGPKTALALLSDVGASPASHAIATQDVKALCQASGVGPKLAERILLELKDKIREEELVRRMTSSGARAVVQPILPKDELVDALLALGYRRQEAEIAAAGARESAESIEDQLKEALRSLRR